MYVLLIEEIGGTFSVSNVVSVAGALVTNLRRWNARVSSPWCAMRKALQPRA
jgi:hypothetical protein